jgi:hypothetical protein
MTDATPGRDSVEDVPTDDDRGIDDDRPAFIDPHTEWVTCFICGQHIEDMSRVSGVDVSLPDDYYPDMRPVCATHDQGGEQA